MKKYIVEYSGHMTVEANSEDEAIEIASEHLYDLDMIAYTPKEWKKIIASTSAVKGEKI